MKGSDTARSGMLRASMTFLYQGRVVCFLKENPREAVICRLPGGFKHILIRKGIVIFRGNMLRYNYYNLLFLYFSFFLSSYSSDKN